MNPELIALIMFGLLVLGLFMGHPLAFVLGGTAVLTTFIVGKPMVLGIVINRIYGDVLDNYTLIAIPLFVLMARFLSDSGVTDRMFETLRLLMSRVRGGLALAVLQDAARKEPLHYVLRVYDGLSAFRSLIGHTETIPEELKYCNQS